MTKTFGTKQLISIAFSIAIILFGRFAAPLDILSAEGNTALALMLGLVVLLLTEALPAGLIGIIGIVVLPLLGLVPTLGAAAALFGNQFFFYLCACYAIAGVMEKSPLSKRILYFLLKAFRNSVKGMITAMILATAILSTFISNFPAAILMSILGKQFLSMFPDEKDRRQTSKSLMIGIVIGVAIGGIATPVGNSCMILASTYLSEAGYPVSFLRWMVFGVPVAAAMFFFTKMFLFKIFPPAPLDDDTRAQFLADMKAQIPEKLGGREWITLTILTATFICWVMNFNLMLVTCICGILLLFPGFGLLTWNEFQKQAGWGTTILICSLCAVVGVLQSTGVLDWLLSLLSAAIPAGAGLFPIILVLGLFTALIVIVMPNGPVLVTVLGTTIIALASQMGVHPAVLLLGFAFFTTFGFIFPTESLALAIYDGGSNFDAKDLPKIGLPLSIFATLVTAAWLPVCAKLFGM